MLTLATRTAGDPLVILDMANNHNGSIEHGKRIIDELAKASANFSLDIVIKFQYRDLDTFIHPDYQSRMDLKYVKRFLSTRLTWSEFQELTDYAHSLGFWTSATPFDETSVAFVERHGHDILKVASASFTDWPLWERIAETRLPVVASTAGAAVEDIDRVVAFLTHRGRDFALMHCVAAYPTLDEDLNLNRIDLLRQRYTGVPVGYSTHEDPSNMVAVGLALAKGAAVLERHVGVATTEIDLNAYSSNSATVASWLSAVDQARAMCGVRDSAPVNADEVTALRGLGRGVFLKRDVPEGTPITTDDIFCAIPLQEGQIASNDWSKYLQARPITPLQAGDPLTWASVEVSDRNREIQGIVESVSEFLRNSGVTYPTNVELEISHHYGLDNFPEVGLCMLTVVNREYCKKLLILLPGQSHPEQYHLVKEETFHVLHGTINLILNGTQQRLSPGSVVIIEPGVRHSFSSETGAVLEEISSTHVIDDSYYTDESITANSARKSFVKYWGHVPH